MIYYILRCYPNDNSTASYNRVRLISEGLKKNGVTAKVDYLFFKQRKTKIFNILECYVFSYIRHSFQFLRLLKKYNKKDVVIIYDFIEQYWVLRLLGRKTNLVVELTEYPLFERNYEKTSGFRNRLFTFYNKCFLKKLKYASFVITCSSYLEKYYHKYISDVFLIPLVVDIDEFGDISKQKKEELGEYIAYCGSFINNKDGLPILIDAYRVFHDYHPQMKLVLIGSGPQNTVNKFKNLVQNYGLNDAVIFTGSLPHDKVREWLSGATILALARPNTRQAEGGVPSKVGEYLACGVPSVITRTGDLPNYLRDGIDCFISEPDSVDSFAKRLDDCYSSDRLEIGKKAVETARLFSNVYQTKLLINYLVNTFGKSIIKN